MGVLWGAFRVCVCVCVCVCLREVVAGEQGGGSGPFLDRGLKRVIFVVGLKTVEDCPCSDSTYEAFVHNFSFH